MLLIALDPLSKPVAIGEIVILLLLTAIVGYILARLVARSGLQLLRDELAEKKVELADCRAIPIIPKQGIATSGMAPNKGARKTVYPTTEPEKGIRQDLKVIEGIGPKIEEILNQNGILNYENLAAMPAMRIAAILRGAGPRFQLHDPTTWPEQATLAHEGKWEELDSLKERLIGGKTE